MWLSIFGYGAWIGLMAALLRRLNPVPALHVGVLIVVILIVVDFEHQFIKGFAAINASVFFTLVLLLLAKPWLTNVLDIGETEPTAVGDAMALPSREQPKASVV